MKKCNSCNISFNIGEKLCPLCQNILSGECNDLSFPSNVRFKSSSLILKILLFVSITLFLIFSFGEVVFFENFDISLYVGLGLISNYVIIYFILKNYKNIYKMFFKYGLIVVILLLMWYFVIKSPIITNYIIPSVCMFELLLNLIVGIVFRKNYLVKYSGHMLVNLILLFVPILLVGLGLTTNNIMAYLCFLFAVISIVGLVIFFYDDIKDELCKIFNV